MSKERIPYFDFYPSDFMHGVRGLSAQEVGVYTMMLCRIYEENGPVEYHVMRLATYCGMREATFAKTVEKLVALGKLVVVDGMIFNERAEAEISNRANKLKINSKAGKASAEKRQQKQGTNSTDVQQAFNHTDTDTDTVIYLERDARERAGNSDLDFQKAFSRWPSFVSDSEGEAMAAWTCLSDADRADAAKWLDAYVEQSRNGGRKTICRFSRYLSEKRWAKVVTISAPEKRQPHQPMVDGVEKYAPMWFAKRMALLAEGPIANIPKPTSFLAKIIAQGGDDAAKFQLDHVSRHGFPRVKAMDEASGAALVEDRYRGFAKLLEPVEYGSAIYRRWQEFFASKGWPWEAPYQQPAFLPKGGPAAIETFITAIKDEVAA